MFGENGLLRREQNRFAISFKLLAMTTEVFISRYLAKMRRDHPVSPFGRATPPREGNHATANPTYPTFPLQGKRNKKRAQQAVPHSCLKTS
jgi:hypothetical protein